MRKKTKRFSTNKRQQKYNMRIMHTAPERFGAVCFVRPYVRISAHTAPHMGHSIPIPRYHDKRRRMHYTASCGYCFARISCRRNRRKMPASILRYQARDFRPVRIGLVLFTRNDTERRKSAIECKIGLYLRYQSGAVCKEWPETVGICRPAAATGYSAIRSTAADRITAGDTALYIPARYRRRDPPAHRPRPASTAGAARRSLTAPA